MPDNWLPIGTPVRVKAVLQKVREEDGSPRWERYEVGDNVWAVVTGRGYRCEGKFYPASGGRSFLGDYESEYEPAYTAVERKLTVALVRFAGWGKEYPASLTDIEPEDPPPGWKLPGRRRLPRPEPTEAV